MSIQVALTSSNCAAVITSVGLSGQKSSKMETYDGLLDQCRFPTNIQLSFKVPLFKIAANAQFITRASAALSKSASIFQAHDRQREWGEGKGER